MVFCYKCGREIEEDTIYCPFCGTNLKTKDQPITKTKRHVSITLCVILLCVFFLLHIFNMIDFMTYGYLTESVGQLFFGVFVLVAAYFLWKSEGIGGIIGIAYAILSIISVLSLPFVLPEAEYSIYDIIFDVCSNIVLIILIIIGWKHLE